jgi:hypothetical protein
VPVALPRRGRLASLAGTPLRAHACSSTDTRHRFPSCPNGGARSRRRVSKTLLNSPMLKPGCPARTGSLVGIRRRTGPRTRRSPRAWSPLGSRASKRCHATTAPRRRPSARCLAAWAGKTWRRSCRSSVGLEPPGTGGARSPSQPGWARRSVAAPWHGRRLAPRRGGSVLRMGPPRYGRREGRVAPAVLPSFRLDGRCWA